MINDKLNAVTTSSEQAAQFHIVTGQLDDLTEKQAAQDSDVLLAIKSASETGTAKGFAAGQADVRQELDALQVKTNNLHSVYTPMQRQLQAQSVDLSTLSKDLNNNTQAQKQAIQAQNRLTAALQQGLDIHAEDLAPDIVRAIQHETGMSLTENIQRAVGRQLSELASTVNAATTQFKLSKQAAQASQAETRATADLIRRNLLASLAGFGGSLLVAIALPGWWGLFSLLPLAITAGYLLIAKEG
ncbi:hypothetical protein ACFP1L_09205 [Lactiplantibacillus nangangensis]|uniref:Uncharacterized protein n=1 Tax=Lactiplantibacillus nangangensis TaxID=2559917 RepID=A0ABW1SL62_9LACO|nr:hypothetical protein [Lactiplantibacillus nangangensis]